LVLLALLLCGCGVATMVAPTAEPAVRQIVTGDGALHRLEERPPTGSPGIDEAAARLQAAPYVPGAPHATNVRARFVAATLTTDRPAQSFQARPVWLVTYVGVPFAPEGCACHGPPMASTEVALDGRTGNLVLVYGADEGRTT
jgi:hypothetical protein